MKPLTEQQAAIYDLNKRGYTAPQIAKALGIAPGQVSDQFTFIRKKGYDIRWISARKPQTVNIEEAKRIAREAKSK